MTLSRMLSARRAAKAAAVGSRNVVVRGFTEIKRKTHSPTSAPTHCGNFEVTRCSRPSASPPSAIKGIVCSREYARSRVSYLKTLRENGSQLCCSARRSLLTASNSGKRGGKRERENLGRASPRLLWAASLCLIIRVLSRRYFLLIDAPLPIVTLDSYVMTRAALRRLLSLLSLSLPRRYPQLIT